MDLTEIGTIANILGSLSLVVSVLLLLKELHESNKLIRASNTQTLVQLSSPFYMGLIQDRKMAELYVQGAQNFGAMDEVDRYRYRTLLIWWLIFHENAYYQWRKRLLDSRSYKPWGNDLQVFIQQQNLGVHWQGMKDVFQDGFAQHMADLIRKYEMSVSQTNAHL